MNIHVILGVVLTLLSTQGCSLGYFGEDCQPCSKTCYNNTCHSENGFCVSGCISGHYGQFCNLSCENCLRGACDASTGECVEETSRPAESSGYYAVHRYWEINDYDEVSNPQDQQQGRAEAEDYDEVSNPQDQQQGRAEAEDYDEVSNPQDQQQGRAEAEDYDEVSNPQDQQQGRAEAENYDEVFQQHEQHQRPTEVSQPHVLDSGTQTEKPLLVSGGCTKLQKETALCNLQEYGRAIAERITYEFVGDNPLPGGAMDPDTLARIANYYDFLPENFLYGDINVKEKRHLLFATERLEQKEEQQEWGGDSWPVQTHRCSTQGGEAGEYPSRTFASLETEIGYWYRKNSQQDPDSDGHSCHTQRSTYVVVDASGTLLGGPTMLKLLRCSLGYFGEDCQPCSKTCYNNTCHPESGVCVSGCISGQYGQFCNLSCANCLIGACDASTGECAEAGFYFYLLPCISNNTDRYVNEGNEDHLPMLLFFGSLGAFVLSQLGEEVTADEKGQGID
ncbi:uncharacterized protein [Haliotis asinina]|uniref:uncharacterized protein n=1 Tax=Haliotis asinina TaxID=109174 RepID=UPI00353219FE